jgi:hypothetical protein
MMRKLLFLMACIVIICQLAFLYIDARNTHNQPPSIRAKIFNDYMNQVRADGIKGGWVR